MVPLMMIARAMWLRRRMWVNASGITTRGWFWEASYYEFYASSFSDACPHWLPCQLYVTLVAMCLLPPLSYFPRSILRVLVLLMTIVPAPYWRLFSYYIVIFTFFIAELVFKPWRLRSVQLLSTVTYFILLFAIFVLARPASKSQRSHHFFFFF